MSLGDERTISGGDAAGLDTVLDDIEIDDLGARYKIERPLGEGGMRAGHCELRKQYQEKRGGNYKRPAQVGLLQPSSAMNPSRGSYSSP
jgi:hypothetical protein